MLTPTACTLVGVLTTREGLLSFAASPHVSVCDAVEVRLGEIEPDSCDWTEACQAIQAAGVPVLITPRNTLEGGRLLDAAPERFALFEQAVTCANAVDIEWASTLRDDVLAMAAKGGTTVVLSYHDFTRCPTAGQLDALLLAMRNHAPGAILKIAAMVHAPEDIALLDNALHNHAPPLCLIGMGSKGAATRSTLPHAGSCLAYAWLDAPSAPGQPSCAELRRAIIAARPSYDH